jgi:hypothetical protein
MGTSHSLGANPNRSLQPERRELTTCLGTGYSDLQAESPWAGHGRISSRDIAGIFESGCLPLCHQPIGMCRNAYSTWMVGVTRAQPCPFRPLSDIMWMVCHG